MTRACALWLCLLALLNASNFTDRMGTACGQEPEKAPSHLGVTESGGNKYALLIGCSKYIHLPKQNLVGPPNDVREMTEALTSRFDFPPNQVRQLVGWPDDESLRPTRQNILREFESLVQKVAPQSHVVLYMSGHGMQIPIPESQSDPLDPKNPEPDGVDEAFLAADAQYKAERYQNLILDDEIQKCLDSLRAKGAHVWVIFDCCFSGDLARGAFAEHSRGIESRDLGVPDSVIRRARDKAKKADKQISERANLDQIIDATTDSTQPGSLVAFYAAQPFEETYDLPFPAAAPETPENFFGLLTHTTLEMLHGQRPTTKLTYRELWQLIINRYRADRGHGGPTPAYAGDIDREVLGQQTWPGRSQIVLKSETGKWFVNAGDLQGVTSDSVFKVFPPTTDLDLSRVVGHVRVILTKPTISQVEPWSVEDSKPAIGAIPFEEDMRCELVTRNLGDLRIHLSVDSAAPDLKPLENIAHDALQQLPAKTAELVEIRAASEPRIADWQLLAVAPQEASERFGQTITAPRLLLIRFGESPADSETIAAQTGDRLATARPVARAYRAYDVNADNFREALEADLLKVFAWQNLWRLAGHIGGNMADPSTEIKVELAATKGPGDKVTVPMARPSVRVGQDLEVRVASDSADRLWITPVVLSSDLEIVVGETQQLNRLGKEDHTRFEIASNRPGTRDCLLIASSAEADIEQPDFRFLAQSPLGQGARKFATPKASQTPFETTMLAIIGQKGPFRGEIAAFKKTPTIVIRSWDVVQPKKGE